MSGCVLANQFINAPNQPLYIPLTGSNYQSGTFSVTAGGSSQVVSVSPNFNPNPIIIINSASANSGVSAVYVSLYSSSNFTVVPCSATFGANSIYKYTILN